MTRKNNFLRNFFIFLAVLGPGIVTANVDNDAGGITTYSVAGATYGYKMLWVFIPMIFALVVVQEMSARMGAVTGKGLADLIRERYGVRVILFVMLALVLANLGNTFSEFAGIAVSTGIFGVSKYISVPLGAALVWWIVVRGSYRQVERVFLVASALYLSYIVSGLFARPNWGNILNQMATPTFNIDSGYLVMLIGLVGTTIAPWMQFYIQSTVVEKGITVKQFGLSRLDVILGCVMTCIVAIFIVISCAATLNAHGIRIETAGDAAVALAPLAGRWASSLFALGLLNASIFSAAILPLSTAYYICEAFGFEAGIDKSPQEAPVFYWLYTLLIVIGAGVILIPNISLIQVMLWSQVINGILLPFILVFILQLINDRDIMGEYVNSPAFNLAAWSTTVVMIGLTIMLVAISVFPGILSGRA
jgi:Mn2+/Fe2+ NRAMP family transporter